MSKREEPTPAEKFEALARKLVAVPKAEVDEAREKAKREKRRRRPA